MRVRSIRIGFEPRDLWIGLYIGPEKYPLEGGKSRKFYLIIIPTVFLSWRVTWS